MRVSFATLVIALCLCIAAVPAQQPNFTGASLKIDNNDGPSYPMQINVRTNTTSVISISGFAGSTFYLAKAGNGNLQQGAGYFFGSICDIPLVPAYVPIADGFVNPLFRIPQSGQYDITVAIPPVGTLPSGIPLNYHEALQCLVADFTAASGYRLSAATRVTVTQGPVIVSLPFEDETMGTVTFTGGFTLPFYGTSYNSVSISSNGFILMGSSQVQDYTPTPQEFNSGPPRIAGFWADLNRVGGIERYVLDTNPGPGIPAYLRVEFLNVTDAYVPGALHNFTMTLDAQGSVEIRHLFTCAASIFDTIVGIGPGNGLMGSDAMKDLSAIAGGSPVLGAVNESFYEWLGIIGTIMPYYTPNPPVSRPYDLTGETMRWVPSGSGALPAVTNRYLMY